MKKDNRRMFLSSAAATMAAFPAIFAAKGNAQTAVSPNEKIQIGIVGCGGMGIGDLEHFLKNDDVDCVAVCDVDDRNIANAVKMTQKHRDHDPATYKDFRRVIEHNDIDAVLVCTPDHWHALPTVFACQAGKDVYVEKPLATTIAEGRAMKTAARTNKRVVQMGTQWRSGKHYAEAVQIVHSGELGTIRQVRAWAYLDWLGGIGNPPNEAAPEGVDYDMWLGPTPAMPFNPNRFHFNFRWFWDYAGGLMTDWGVHLLNICLWAMGPEPPKTCYSSGGKLALDDMSETPDTQVAVYDFPKYTLIWEHQIQGGVGIGGRPHGMSFSGTNATLILDADGWEILPEKEKGVAVRSGKSDGDGRIEHIRNFLDCVASRNDPVEHVDLAHFVSSVAHLGNLAIRSGQQIAWDAENERITNSEKANRLLGVEYRKPWTMPYYKSA